MGTLSMRYATMPCTAVVDQESRPVEERSLGEFLGAVGTISEFGPALLRAADLLDAGAAIEESVGLRLEAEVARAVALVLREVAAALAVVLARPVEQAEPVLLPLRAVGQRRGMV